MKQVLMFEPAEVVQILRDHGHWSDGQLLDVIANYTRVHHPSADADSVHFHDTGLVVCNLKPKKGK